VNRHLEHKAKRLDLLRTELQAAESCEQSLTGAHSRELDGLQKLENEAISLEEQCAFVDMMQ
jgi:hypothetical protein